MSWLQLLGDLGSGLSAGAMIMTRMIPLRLMVIASNIVFMAYGALTRELGLLALHAVMLPLNLYRLHQMQTLIAKVEKASSGEINMDWLSTFMRRQPMQAGEMLFSRGDPATSLYYIVSGTYRIPELRVDLGAGKMVGEVGLLAPERKRSQSLQCIEAGELLVISYDEVNELYFQNPQFGYHFLQLVTKRLFSDLGRLEKELATRQPMTRNPE